MTYYIKYTESYSDIYKVDADSFKEAVEKLDEDTRTGYRNGPELCDDSFYTEVRHD